MDYRTLYRSCPALTLVNPVRRRSTVLPYWGACGFVLGVIWGGLGGYLTGEYFDMGERYTLTLAGTLASCFGISGAILGTARDVMKFFRDSHRTQQRLEADYEELPPFPDATRKSTHS